MKTSKSAFTSGFSLIDVLVAVVVLSFGLLALAALQTKLVRSSGATKAQSTALALAKDEIEQLRGFEDLDAYIALTDIAKADAITATLGGVSYSMWRDVTRYAYDTTATPPAFTAVGDTTALGNAYTAANEFKVVDIYVEWTDPTGATESIRLQDAVGALAPANSGRLVRKRQDTAGRGPKVIIKDPSTSNGVIPIAIGDGSETAATNPRPEIASSNRQTSFDIFTYSALTDADGKKTGNAVAQARVETTIVGCTCDTTEASKTDKAYRPTYWNGQRYAEPEIASYDPKAGWVQQKGKSETENGALCTICCRDHWDPASIGANEPKFSPRRTGGHTHFLDDLDNAVTSGEYYEACRLIRVDGITRVAADPYNEFFNLLKTNSESDLSNASSNYAAPEDFNNTTDDAVGHYQDFVIDYLDKQFTKGNTASYNTQLTSTDQAKLVDDNDLDYSALALEKGNKPWFHARGLFVDYLENDAIAAINEAKTTCALEDDSEDPDGEIAAGNASKLSQCVLRTLPFTTINLTETSIWKPRTGDGDSSGDSVIVVDNNAFYTSGGSLPVRGKGTPLDSGDTNVIANARVTNSGLLGVDGDTDTFVINKDEQAGLTASRAIKVSGPSCGNSNMDAVTKGVTTPILFPSEASCEGPSAGTTLATIRLQVSLSLNTGPNLSKLKIELVGPVATNCTFLLENNAGAEDPPYSATYSVAATDSTVAACDPRSDGTWTLRVTSSATGNPPDLKGSWSLKFLDAGAYTVSLANYTFAPGSYPAFDNAPTATCDYTSTAGGPNPWTCVASEINVDATIRVSGYNYQAPDDTSVKSVEADCTYVTNKGEAKTTTCTVATASRPSCYNHSVEAVYVNGTEQAGLSLPVMNDGKASETTSFTLKPLNEDDVVEIRMLAPTKVGGGYTCSLKFEADCSKGVTFNWNADPCS